MNKEKQLNKLRKAMSAVETGQGQQSALFKEWKTASEVDKNDAHLNNAAPDNKQDLFENTNELRKALKKKKSKQEKSPEQIARDYALGCINRREHGSRELLKKMLAKEYAFAICDKVIQDLQASDVLSDQRFATSMVRYGAFKGHGPVKIRQDLKNKELANDYMNQAFDELEIDWYALAKDIRVKKYGDTIPKEWKDKAKQMRFLQQRGFDNEHINASF